MIGRSVRHGIRNTDALIMAVVLPVMMMLLFVYVFGGAINTGTEYVTYVVPGIILLCASFGSATTAVSVCNDMVSGIVDRFRSMPITQLGRAHRPRRGEPAAQPGRRRSWWSASGCSWASGRTRARSSGSA